MLANKFKEILESISELDISEIIKYFDTHSELVHLLKDKQFLHELSVINSIPNITKLENLTEYICLDIDRRLEIALLNDDLEGSERMLKLGGILNQSKDLFNAFYINARNGHNNNTIRLILELDTDRNNVLINSSLYGFIDLVESSIENNATNFNYAMSEASNGGHFDIVELLIEKGADDYNRAMKEAARNGHIHIIRHMLELGADDYDRTTRHAIFGGQFNIVQWMLQLGADNYYQYIIDAASCGHIGIINLLLQYIDNTIENYNDIMNVAVDHMHLDIARLMISLGVNDNNIMMKYTEALK